MPKKVVLIHTVPLLINTFNQLGATILPDVEFMHVLNEVLIERVRINGGTTDKDNAWLRAQVSMAEEINASAILVTCTILSAVVDEIRPEFSMPIIKIDAEMAKNAIEIGPRIGIIVTNPDTIEPSSRLIKDYAAKVNKEVIIKSKLVEDAFDAVRNGNGAKHDELVRKCVFEMAKDVDVIILAQASMARVLDIIPINERPVPILSSPYLAFDRLKTILEKSS